MQLNNFDYVNFFSNVNFIMATIDNDLDLCESHHSLRFCGYCQWPNECHVSMHDRITSWYLSRLLWPLWCCKSPQHGVLHVMMNNLSNSVVKMTDYRWKIVPYACMLSLSANNSLNLMATMKTNEIIPATWEWDKVTQHKIKHTTELHSNCGEEEHITSVLFVSLHHSMNHTRHVLLRATLMLTSHLMQLFLDKEWRPV